MQTVNSIVITDTDILGEAGRSPVTTVRELIANIVNRNLYKRALVISMNTFDRPDSKTGSVEEDAKLSPIHKLAFATKDVEGPPNIESLQRKSGKWQESQADRKKCGSTFRSSSS
jgi:hypothetical protein